MKDVIVRQIPTQAAVWYLVSGDVRRTEIILTTSVKLLPRQP
jgi:hypothetical protein